MRRWLMMFLLVWMPLQSLWAVAAPYCSHERTAPATHLGHHEHDAHAAERDDANQGSSDGAGASCAEHANCHACHGHCAALPQAQAAAPAAPPQHGMAHATQAPWPSAPVALPDRPNWINLAVF
jgi:hypothetical protein